MEGVEGDILRKAPDQKSLFFYKIKIKQKPCSPNKKLIQSSRIFIWILGPIREKNLHWLMIEKYCIMGRNKARRDVGKHVWFVVKSDGSLGGVTIPGTFCNSYPWKTIFPKKMRSPDRAKFKKRRNLFVNFEKRRSTA